MTTRLCLGPLNTSREHTVCKNPKLRRNSFLAEFMKYPYKRIDHFKSGKTFGFKPALVLYLSYLLVTVIAEKPCTTFVQRLWKIFLICYIEHLFTRY